MYQRVISSHAQYVEPEPATKPTIDTDTSQAEEDSIQEASEESFPASDSPASSGQDPIVSPLPESTPDDKERKN